MKNIFIVIKKSRFFLILIAILLLFSHVVLYSSVLSYKKVVDSVNDNIFNSFSKDEADSESNIFFVANLNDKTLGKENPELKLPSLEDYELNDGIFIFKAKNNFVVFSAGYGIVKSVGYLENGLKYVEIKHSGNIITRYENLKIVGVGANFLVKKIHIIGTIEDTFIFKILKNNKVVTNYTIENGEILWQN